MFSSRYRRYYVCYGINGETKFVCPPKIQTLEIDNSSIQRQVSSRMRLAQRIRRNSQLR